MGNQGPCWEWSREIIFLFFVKIISEQKTSAITEEDWIFLISNSRFHFETDGKVLLCVVLQKKYRYVFLMLAFTVWLFWKGSLLWWCFCKDSETVVFYTPERRKPSWIWVTARFLSPWGHTEVTSASSSLHWHYKKDWFGGFSFYRGLCDTFGIVGLRLAPGGWDTH